MDLREELAERERTSWDAFVAEVDAVPQERLTTEGVVPGWSVKDIVWHCAGWARFAGDHLQSMRDGTFRDPFEGVPDEHWDAVSQEMIDAARAMSVAEVRRGAEEARTRVRGMLSSLPEVDELAARWFSEETFDHYDEHAREIRAFRERG